MGIIIPAFIRGHFITDQLEVFGGRGGEAEFEAPSSDAIIDKLPLADPGALSELYDLRFSDIVDFLVELGERLDIEKNDYLREAMEHSFAFSDATPPLVQMGYESLSGTMTRERILEETEHSLGLKNVDGWRQVRLYDGRLAHIRAFGSRAVHIVAGNSPLVSAISIVRNAITRSDAIIKAPSNDPLTALAIARTMADIGPDHPLTRHVSVAYWKGGDEAFEERLYKPANVEKIIAWGGLASIKHVTKYIQPGLELIALDPKRSISIIGREAFIDEQTMREVALRTASDVGALNQLGCVNSRVVFAACGTDDDGLALATRFGEMVFEEIQSLPSQMSTPAKRPNADLRANVEALRTSSDFYKVIGARSNEGGVIVSLLDEPVDFYPSLADRTANIVPIDEEIDALRFMNSYAQTIGIYPESLKERLRDILPLYGAQRIISLGYAVAITGALPQDGIEPVRRMSKWIVEESFEPARIPGPWTHPDEQAAPALVN